MQSNLAWENTGAAWYSSMLLLLVAIVSMLCFIKEAYQVSNKKPSFLSYGWLVFGLIFLTLSLDEIGSIHENVDQIAFFKAIGFGGGLQSNMLYAVILLVGLFMVSFFWARFKQNKTALLFVVLGTLCYISNPIQERIEVAEMMAAPDYNTWKRPIYYFILEEGSEIFGTLFFLIAVSLYVIYGSIKSDGQQQRSFLQIRAYLPKKTILNFCLLLISSLSLFFWITKIDLHSTAERGDNGIPQNWFPAAVAFLVSTISLYTCLDKYKRKHKAPFLLLGLFSLFNSFYWGSNMYERVFEKEGLTRLLPLLILSITAIFTSITLTRINNGKWMNMSIIGWMILLILGINLPIYAPALCYLSFSLLFLSLCYHQANDVEQKGTDLKTSASF